MKKTTEGLRRERITAGISQTELGEALCRSQVWVSLLERGRIPTTVDMEGRVLTAIRRLAEFSKAAEEQRRAMTQDLARVEMVLTVRLRPQSSAPSPCWKRSHSGAA